MCLSEPSGVAWEQHAEQVVAARLGAQQQEQPRALHVGHTRYAVQQDRMFFTDALQRPGHVRCVPERRAQNGNALRFRRPRPAAYPGVRASGGRTSPAAFHARVLPKCTRTFARSHTASPRASKKRAGSLRPIRDVNVIEVGIQILLWAQGSVRLQQGSVLPKSVQRRHERVALLAAALSDLIRLISFKTQWPIQSSSASSAS